MTVVVTADLESNLVPQKQRQTGLRPGPFFVQASPPDQRLRFTAAHDLNYNFCNVPQMRA